MEFALNTFGQWGFTSDRGATIVAYADAVHGGSDRCKCNGCRNFAAARSLVYPPAFLSLLESLGIDPRKDGEVYHNGQLAPGCHDYGGWFHFVGTLERTGDFPMVAMSEHFEVWLVSSHSPALAGLRGLPLVEVAFHATAVPWMLNEPEAM